MKKFVRMHDINRVFDDMESVDYVTVVGVTDSKVDLEIHLKSLSVPVQDSKEYSSFVDRCLVLGKILDRRVNFVLVKAQFLRFIFRPFTGVFDVKGTKIF